MLDASTPTYKRFRRLAGKGDVDGVRTLLQLWPQRAAVPLLAFRLGKWAVDNDWPAMLAVALEPEHGVDFDRCLEKGYEGFLTYVVRQRPSLLEALLKAGVSPDGASSTNECALHQASALDNVEAARLLLDYNADPDGRYKGKEGAGGWHRHTPLSDARSGAMVRLLLEKGASPGARMPGGETALMRFRKSNRDALEKMVQAWVASGASIDVLAEASGEKVEETAMEWALTSAQINSKHPFHSLYTTDHIPYDPSDIHDLQLVLYANGASLDHVAADGRALWEWVADTGGPGLKKVLLDRTLPHPETTPSSRHRM